MYRILLLLVSLLMVSNTLAQESSMKVKVFTIDLSNPLLDIKSSTEGKEAPLTIKHNHYAQIVLKNPNPLKYDYELNNQLLDFFEDSLNSFKVEGSNSSDLAEQKNDDDIVSQINTKINITDDTSRDKYVSNLNEALIQLELPKDLSNSLIAPFVESFNDKLEEAENEDVAKNASKKKAASSIIEATNYYNQIVALQKQDITDSLAKLKAHYENLEKDLDRFISDSSVEDYLQKSEFQASRKILDDRNNELYANLKNLAQIASSIPEYAKIFNQSVADCITPLANTIKTKINKLKSIKWSHYTLPIDAHGENIDVIEFTLKIHTKKEKGGKVVGEKTYSIWVTGGFKFDVSSGVFFSSLLNAEYTTTSQESTDETQANKKIIHERNLGNYNIGFGAILNTTFRSKRDYKFTLNIGGIITQDESFQFLVGGGIILGKKQRLIFHGGLTMGSVTRIQEQFKADGTTGYDLGENGAVPITQRFDFGHYFGVTYNLGGTKAVTANTENNN